MANADQEVVRDFGREWAAFDQSALADTERQAIFHSYFAVFPWHRLPKDGRGFDLGCGSGRWARLVAPRVGELHCIDASVEALTVAKRNLAGAPNCVFHAATVDAIPLPDDSMDFGYSLGVLHHVPDTVGGLKHCVRKLKPGAPFLVYLYYAFDHKPAWFKVVWRITDVARRVISRFPFPLKYAVSQLIAATVYAPAAFVARAAEKLGLKVDNLPLSAYRHKSYYTMRTDALDRFGTRLEKRFTRAQIALMMEEAGLVSVTFSNEVPFWCAVGFRK